jgi:CYTH domain-containing protein
MDKTYKDELHRLFLLHKLPEPLTRASSHLQIFDNYIENTRMRLRVLREPATKKMTHILQQRFPAENLGHWKIAEIYLNEIEHKQFEQFEGREIRKNRYFHDYDFHQFEIDVYLGNLWGLNTAKVLFETEEDLQNFKMPNFIALEVTDNSFFNGENLVEKTFADVQKEVSGISKGKIA